MVLCLRLEMPSLISAADRRLAREKKKTGREERLPPSHNPQHLVENVIYIILLPLPP